MEIIKDELIRNKWHRGFERKKPVDEIVLHGTGGGGTYAYVLNGGRKELYKQGIALFHYLIDQTGKVTEIIDPDRWVYHSSSGVHDERTIGIEILNPDGHNQAPYTQGQYWALFSLIDIIREKYQIKKVVGHDYNYKTFSGDTKGCPGNFAWARLEDYFKRMNITYKTIAPMAYEVSYEKSNERND